MSPIALASLLLAGVSFGAPPSGPAPAACQADAARYCPDVRADLCLPMNWGRVSGACREALLGSGNQPCLPIIRSYCMNVAPTSGLGECVDEHLDEASDKCRAKIEASRRAFPCYGARQAFCADLDKPEARVSCLMKHLDGIPWSCVELMRRTPVWIDQCASDTRRHCHGLETTVSEERDKCLTAHLDELTPWCRRMMRRSQRAATCLGPNGDATSASCREELKTLRLGPRP